MTETEKLKYSLMKTKKNTFRFCIGMAYLEFGWSLRSNLSQNIWPFEFGWENVSKIHSVTGELIYRKHAFIKEKIIFCVVNYFSSQRSAVLFLRYQRYYHIWLIHSIITVLIACPKPTRKRVLKNYSNHIETSTEYSVI